MMMMDLLARGGGGGHGTVSDWVVYGALRMVLLWNLSWMGCRSTISYLYIEGAIGDLWES